MKPVGQGDVRVLPLRLKLLLIDDSDDDCELAQRALERSGFGVTAQRVECPDSLEAALEDREWDLCLLDWVIPELTAPEALRLLRASRQPQLPVIVWSGKGDPKIEYIAVEVLGAVGFLTKGEMRTRLVELVTRAIAPREELQ